METTFITVAVLVVAITSLFVLPKLNFKKSRHSASKMLRFAESAAGDVLSCNWQHDEYYGRMYKYASAELASQMYKNKSLLNSVLDERADLLGDYISINNLEMGRAGLQILPVQTYEVSADLQCSKAGVPIVILVNAGGEELSLDGIKILKKEVKLKH